MQNLSKSTFFKLNSFTVHVSHSATWVSVHCLGSEETKHECDHIYVQDIQLESLTLLLCTIMSPVKMLK